MEGVQSLMRLLIALSALSAATALFAPDEKHIRTFTPEEYEANVVNGDGGPWVMDFFVPHCGKCQMLVAILRQIAQTFEHAPQLKFGAMDCVEHNIYCTKVGATAHPTIRAYNFKRLSEKVVDIPVTDFNFTKIGTWIEDHLGIAAGSAPPMPAPQAGSPAPAPLHAKGGAETAAMRLVDAQAATLFTFRRSVFLGAKLFSGGDGEDSLTLFQEPYTELKEWLKILPGVLPGAEADLKRYSEASKATNNGFSMPWRVWEPLVAGGGLGSVPAEAAVNPGPYWKICRSYTCGLWTLFYMTVLSAAEGRIPGVTPEDAIDRVRGFVEHFFSCEECKVHFLEAPINFKSYSDNEGLGAVIWLWMRHSDAGKRVAEVRGLKRQAYPAYADCPECWPNGDPEKNDDWSAHTGGIYRYLLNQHLAPPQKKTDMSMFIVIGVVVIGGVLVYWLLSDDEDKKK